MATDNRRELARLITRLEAGESVEIPRDHPLSPAIGITGPPGAGKSTLAGALITDLRSRGLTVGVVAVDPSSPVTGGAILGDRIRMQGHVDDPGVFVRSMASRGHLGGLAASTGDVLQAMTRSGFDVVLVETVGVGQSEVEVMHLVETVVLVLSPGWGDQVQADKAGIVEVADVFVVNKGDQPGVDALVNALRNSVGEDRPILVTTATTGEGVRALADQLLRS